MAVILPNISASLSSFKVNSLSKALLKLSGTYGTADILNGGETLDNELEYTFSISNLDTHTIGVIYIKSLLLDSNGELIGLRKLAFNLNGLTYSGTINASDSVKTLITTPFVINETIDGKYDVVLKVTSNDIESCYYGLHSILIELSDIPYSVQLRFTGPKTYRSINNITVSAIVVNRGSLEVSFSKDPTTDYNKDIHNIEGRIYYLHDGIYVDGFKHSYNLPATSTQLGVVKLLDAFELDNNGLIIPPTENGIAASTLLVYSVTLPATDKIRGIVYIKNSFDIDEETGGIIAPTDSGIAVSTKMLYDVLSEATEDKLGLVRLSGPSFEIDEKTGGVIAPSDSGIAASTLLVYNTMATLKEYVDSNKLDVYIDEDDDTNKIENQVIFGKSFERDGLNRINLTWLEIAN